MCIAVLNDRPAIRAPWSRARRPRPRGRREHAVDHDGRILHRLAGLGLEQRVADLAAAQLAAVGVEGDRLGAGRADVDAEDDGRLAVHAAKHASRACGFPAGGRRAPTDGAARRMGVQSLEAVSSEGRLTCPVDMETYEQEALGRARPAVQVGRLAGPGRDPRRGARPARRGPPRLPRLRVLRRPRAHHRAGQPRRRGGEARWHVDEHRDRRRARGDDGTGGRRPCRRTPARSRSASSTSHPSPGRRQRAP